MATTTMPVSRNVGERSTPRGARRPLRTEQGQMDRALKLGFVFFLPLVAVGRLVGWKLAAPEARGSIVTEARYAANTYVPLGFSGW